MKNIHVLPTDKPSRLHEYDYLSPMGLSKEPLQWRLGRNIYITSDEEIKEGDWYVNTLDEVVRKNNTINHSYHKKIILTTNQDLINDGVQAIDDEFLEWFVKNPSCEEVEVENERIVIDDINYNFDVVDYKYKIIIPKEELKKEILKEVVERLKGKELFKESNDRARKILSEIKSLPIQETLEEAAIKHSSIMFDHEISDSNVSFKSGAKWQQERMYSEEEVLEMLSEVRKGSMVTSSINNRTYWEFDIKSEKKCLEQFKKK